VLARQVERALGLAPQLVTISIGPNDITTHVSVADHEHNVVEIFDRRVRPLDGADVGRHRALAGTTLNTPTAASV
jgi:hypothetical protein